jgi:hypothetical protein
MYIARRRGLTVAAACFSAAVSVAVLADADAGAGARGGESSSPFARMNFQIEQAAAEKKTLGADFEKHIKKAAQIKESVVREQFQGQNLFGCPAGDLLFELDELDSTLVIGNGSTGGERRKNLKRSAELADVVAAKMSQCAGAGEAERAIAAEIQAAVKDVRDGRQPDDAVQEAHDLKGRLLTDEKLSECDAFTIYDAVADLDLLLAEILATEPGDFGGRRAREHAEEVRETLADRLKRRAKSLELVWSKIPCHPPTTPDPDPPPTDPTDPNPPTNPDPVDPEPVCGGGGQTIAGQPAGHRGYIWSCPVAGHIFSEYRLDYNVPVVACMSQTAGTSCAVVNENAVVTGTMPSQTSYSLLIDLGSDAVSDSCATDATLSQVENGVRTQESPQGDPPGCVP